MEPVERYLSTVPPEMRTELIRVRSVIAKLVPDAQEGISYGMPVFKYKNKYLIGYAAFKKHMSVFPGGEAVHILGNTLDGYTTSKGTIQFTCAKPLPVDTLKKIVLLRIHMIDTA